MAHQLSASPAGDGSGREAAGHGPGPFGDTTYTKVFVGGLAWETQSDSLRRYFEQFGDVLEGVVIADKHTGRSKGYGFVTFRDPEAASRACANPNPVIDGRRANCNLASLGSPHGTHRSTMGFQTWRGVYGGSPIYQLPVPYGFQPGLPYPSYRFPAYAPEYAYSQMYGLVGPNSMPYGHMSPQPGYTMMMRGYFMPGPHMAQYHHRPYVSGTIPDNTPTMQVPVRSHFLQFPHGGTSSDQTS